MKALTTKVKAEKEVGFSIKRASSVLNERSEPNLKLLENENELLREAGMMRIFHVDPTQIHVSKY